MISERLAAVIRRTLRVEGVELQPSTRASEVPGWDSLAHVRVLAAVEEEFGVRFATLEVLRLANVGQLQALLEKKLGRAP